MGRGRGKQIVLEDADNYEQEESDEDEEKELVLPETLIGLSVNDRKELVQFKKSHTEVEWEEELLRRSELLGRKVDFERLKKMTKSSTGPSAAPSTGKGKRGRPVAATGTTSKVSIAAAAASKNKRPRGGKKVVESDDDEDEEEEEDEEEDEEDEEEDEDDDPFKIGAGGLSEDSDEDLFDSDEEAEISKQFKKPSKDDNDEDEEDEGDDVDEEEDDDDPFAASDDDEEEEIVVKKAASSKSRNAKVSDEVSNKKKSTTVEKLSTTSAGLRRSSRSKILDDNEDDFEDGEESDDDLPGRLFVGGKSRVDLDMDMDVDNDITAIKSAYKNMNNAARKGATAVGASLSYNNNMLVKRVKTKLAGPVGDLPDPSGTAAGLEDYLKIQIRRFTVEKWLDEPYLSDAAIGGFVRFYIGMLPETGEMIYRMAEIVDVDLYGRQYMSQVEKKTMTIRFTVQIGSMVKANIKIDQLSNSRFTATEFFRYSEAHAKSKTYKLLTKTQARQRRERMLEAVKHVYTDEEVKAMVLKRQGLDRSVTTEYHTAFERLKRRQTMAQEAKDYDELDKVARALETLEREFNSQKELFDRVSSKHVSLNLRNRDENFRKDIQAAEKKKAQDAQGGVNTLNNPYLRRETRPQNLWQSGNKLELALQELKDEEKKDGATPRVASTSNNNNSNNPLQSSTQNNRRARRNEQLQQQQDNLVLGKVSIDEVRENVRQRIGKGIDPYEVSREDPRIRYLRVKCASLPALGSEEREKLRRGMSLAAMVEQLAKQREEQEDEEMELGEEEQ